MKYSRDPKNIKMRFILINVGQLAAKMPFGARQYMIYTSPTQPGPAHQNPSRNAGLSRSISENRSEFYMFGTIGNAWKASLFSEF